MQATEHLRTAREFLAAADQAFANGNRLKGSERLWGAASHALIAIAQQRTWPHCNYRALKQATRLLVDETGDMALLAGSAAAEKFRANSCYEFMEEFELNADRPMVIDFVERLHALAD